MPSSCLKIFLSAIYWEDVLIPLQPEQEEEEVVSKADSYHFK